MEKMPSTQLEPDPVMSWWPVLDTVMEHQWANDNGPCEEAEPLGVGRENLEVCVRFQEGRASDGSIDFVRELEETEPPTFMDM